MFDWLSLNTGWTAQKLHAFEKIMKFNYSFCKGYNIHTLIRSHRDRQKLDRS